MSQAIPLQVLTLIFLPPPVRNLVAKGDTQVKGVLVDIFGEQYRIGGDPKQVQQVAAYVDTKMKEIAGKNPRMPKAQVAMLATMEVTADLFKVMSERKVFTERAHESVERLTRLVEDRANLTPSVTEGAGDHDDRLGERLQARQAVSLPESTPIE